MVADAWLMPAREDVKAKRPLLNELTVLPTKSESSGSRSDILKRFTTLFSL